MKYLLIFSVSLLLSYGPIFADETVSLGKEVTLHYTLTLDDGSVVSSTRGKSPLNYIHGTHKLVPGLEKALEGMHTGETKSVLVKPEDAYGQFEAGKIVEVKKSDVQGDLKVGAFLQGSRPNGEVVRSRILEIKDDSVVLDFNHPMAGKNLHYDIEVLEIKNSAASPVKKD